jgi:hypothetical protein
MSGTDTRVRTSVVLNEVISLTVRCSRCYPKCRTDVCQIERRAERSQLSFETGLSKFTNVLTGQVVTEL